MLIEAVLIGLAAGVVSFCVCALFFGDWLLDYSKLKDEWKVEGDKCGG